MPPNHVKLRHKEWRKLAKKLRRKKIRQRRAKERDEIIRKEQETREKSPSYQEWLAKEEELEKFTEQEEERLNMEKETSFWEEERLAQERWRAWKKKQARLKKELAEQEERIRKEWQEEQRKAKEAEEEKQRQEKEKQEKQEALMQQIADFLSDDKNITLPPNFTTESNPNKPPCPFFSKTGACRFGDRCTRDHVRPLLSKVLLIPNFYSHFLIEQSLLDEYDTDLSLEYEDSETYQHFKEFYEDVVPEFGKIGNLNQFKVCCNCEPHLRGNVYVEYETEREAYKAAQAFNGRWYGGKQLSVEFATIPSWKAALCGLFHRKKCPKGKGCNFLHVFRNPNNEFNFIEDNRSSYRNNHYSSSRRYNRSRSRSPDSQWSQRWQEENRQSRSSSQRHWRWTPSPEIDDFPPSSNSKVSRKNSSRGEGRSHRKVNSRRKTRRRSRSRSRSRRSRSRSKVKRQKSRRSRSKSVSRSSKSLSP